MITVALLLAVLTSFATHWIFGVQVFQALALLVVLVVVVLTVRDLLRLSRPTPRKRVFRWVRFVLADLAISALMLAGMVWWLGEQARPPTLAEGMWWNRDCCNVESGYDARLRHQFLGRSEATLLLELERQDFELRGPGHARADWWDLACSHFATVEWSANEAGEVAAIRGDVGSVCL